MRLAVPEGMILARNVNSAGVHIVCVAK